METKDTLMLIEESLKNKLPNLQLLVDQGILEKDVASSLINDPDFP